MKIIKVTHRNELDPQTLVEVLEDQVNTWGITEPSENGEELGKLLIASSVYYPNQPERDQRHIYDLEGGRAFLVNVYGKRISLEQHHPVGEIRHVDHIEEWGRVESMPTFQDIAGQFEKAGYTFEP